MANFGNQPASKNHPGELSKRCRLWLHNLGRHNLLLPKYRPSLLCRRFLSFDFELQLMVVMMGNAAQRSRYFWAWRLCVALFLFLPHTLLHSVVYCSGTKMQKTTELQILRIGLPQKCIPVCPRSVAAGCMHNLGRSNFFLPKYRPSLLHRRFLQFDKRSALNFNRWLWQGEMLNRERGISGLEVMWGALFYSFHTLCHTQALCSSRTKIIRTSII